MAGIFEAYKRLIHSMDLVKQNKIQDWYNFILQNVIEPLENSAPFISEENPSLKNGNDDFHAIPKLLENPVAGADFKIIHQFDEQMMQKFGDIFIKGILRYIRESKKLVQFQGEEVLSAWYSDNGVKLPNLVQGFGEYSQGGYIMYMSPFAKQHVHQHGIRLSEGKYFPNSGSRFLIGLIGAEKTSIRHVEGVFCPPRGSLVTIHFKQDSTSAGAAHQFWNDGGEVGNLFLSIHNKDTMDSHSEKIYNSANLINLRTYEFEDEILEKYNSFIRI